MMLVHSCFKRVSWDQIPDAEELTTGSRIAVERYVREKRRKPNLSSLVTHHDKLNQRWLKITNRVGFAIWRKHFVLFRNTFVNNGGGGGNKSRMSINHEAVQKEEGSFRGEQYYWVIRLSTAVKRGPEIYDVPVGSCKRRFSSASFQSSQFTKLLWIVRVVRVSGKQGTVIRELNERKYDRGKAEINDKETSCSMVW